MSNNDAALKAAVLAELAWEPSVTVANIPGTTVPWPAARHGRRRVRQTSRIA